MRVLITGVGGFLGPRMAAFLAARGNQVFGTYLQEMEPIEGVELIYLDILDTEMLAAAVERAAPDVVVHLAGLSSVGESWNRIADYFQANVIGTENVLQAVGGLPLVFASSAEVYGRVPESAQPISEESPLRPRNPYAVTKAAAERMVLAANGTVVRTFNVVGPGQAETFALPSFARQLAAAQKRDGAKLKVGNLAARREFLHVDDAVSAYGLLVEQGEPGWIYNLGSGEAVSVEEALEMLMEASGVRLPIEVDPRRVRPVDIELTCAEISRLERLGWKPQKNLAQALGDLWVSVRAV